MNTDDMYYRDAPESFRDVVKIGEVLKEKNNDSINKFLGKEPRTAEAYSTQRYYKKLLAWTLKCITSSAGWEIVSLHGYMDTKPVFGDIQTDYTEYESCLVDGQMLVKKNGIRLVITIYARAGFIQIEAGEEHGEMVKKLKQDLEDFLKVHNFYRGKRLSLDEEISFLNVAPRDWSSVILAPSMKEQIRLNTIGFLRHCSQLADLGWPFKRGIILSSEPGNGKTSVVKALMSEADHITCITSDAYGLLNSGYISDLFAIAQDLSPSIVFLEDLDFIGQERQDFYRGTPPLIALLAEMDGIQEKTAIVTVATTNCVETLDKALSERPSRFDRIFIITRPDYKRRIEMLKYLSQKIQLSQETIEYIARKTDGYNSAQVEEVPRSMVIKQLEETGKVTGFNQRDVDAVISQMNHKKGGTIGFNSVSYRDPNLELQ
jgi:cell division protease FtsH